MADIKTYKPQSNSVGNGQILPCAYTAEKTRLVVREMAEYLALGLVDKGIVTEQLVLTVGYDRENLTDLARRKTYNGAVTIDHYGRQVPKHAHGTANLAQPTSSSRKIVEAVLALYDRIIDPALLTRRLNLTACHVVGEAEAAKARESSVEQLDLFTDYAARALRQAAEEREEAKEKKIQHAMLDIQKKFGKNAILKGMDLQEGATARERNVTIGGHKA